MLFLGCGSNDPVNPEPTPPATDVYLSINPSDFTAQISGGSQSVAVISNTEWTVSSNADWCTCSPKSGAAGNSTVSISAAGNYTGADRSAEVTFTAGSVSKKCTVSQAGDNITLSISANEISIPADGGAQNVTVTSNVGWAVSSDADWLTYSPKSGAAGSKNVSISAAGNYTGAARSAEVTFTSGAITKKCTVNQDFTELPNYVPDGYTLVWQDEFSTSRLPDTQKWWYETGANGWGNNELENYIPGFQGTDTCAIISDGTLKIIAKKVGSQVLSIRMNTSDSWQYGYFEARLKMPSGKGTWPAFWMMPKNFTSWPLDGEIDIMEYVGYRPDVAQASTHCQAYNGAAGNNKTGTIAVPGAEKNFYVYGLLWTADKITAYVNGVEYFSYPNDHTNNKNTWPFNAPFYLKLNLAWGGNWGGLQGVDESKLPATYEIDYVRVYQQK